jgi:hypothetical protein|tara:strand:- start:3924 stop:4064 length:141 start_codon:yes stop_codon:yes gene_type:complete
MNKQELIATITRQVQRTHGADDIADLQLFSMKELLEIINELKEQAL